MENKGTDMIIKNVKIDKTIFVEIHTHEEWLWLFKECHSHYRKDMKKFVCVYCHYKKNSKMRIDEHQKKGCDKAMDSKGNLLKLKLYPPLRNATNGCVSCKR
jgi:hypothetical protein